MKNILNKIKYILLTLVLVVGLSLFTNSNKVFAGWDSNAGDDGYSTSCPGGTVWNGSSCVVNTPTVSTTVSPDPVDYGVAATITFHQSYGSNCYLAVDWGVVSGWNPIADGATFSAGVQAPGSHHVDSYCYNSSGVGSGWSYTYYTVKDLSVSISVTPSVNVGTSPTVSITSVNGYYCQVYSDSLAAYIAAPGYFGSGSWSIPLQAPGSYNVRAHCYNTSWIGVPTGWVYANYTVNAVPAPTILSYSCNSPGTSATVTWSDPAGWNNFYIRATNSGGANIGYPGWDDGKVGTSVTFPTTPGASYNFWVHTRYPGNAAWYSSATYTPVINCALDGGWSGWSAQDNTCGASTVTRTQTRTCNNPTPANGGAACPGSSTQTYSVAACASNITNLSIPATVTYGSSPTYTYSCANGYYSHVILDESWAWQVSGVYSSATNTIPAQTSPGSHHIMAYCYNSDMVPSANSWLRVYYTVTNPPTATLNMTDAYFSGYTHSDFSTYYGNPGVALSWSSTDASSCSITDNGASMGASGTSNGGWAVGYAPTSTHTYVLTCNNGYGYTATDTRVLTIPPQPIGLTGSCSANGLTGSFSWTAPGGYNTFYTRATQNGANMAAPAWDDNFVGTSKTFSTVPGATYSIWIHSKASNGAWSAAPGVSYTCPNPAPSETFTVTDNWAYGAYQNANISTYAWNTGVALSWSSANATSCSVTDNGAATAWSGTSNTITGIAVNGITHTYVLTCSNPYAGSTSVTRVVTIPTDPTSVTFNNTTCTGNTLTLSWNQNASYGGGGSYIYDNGVLLRQDDPTTVSGASKSIAFATIPGHQYTATVYARDATQPSSPYSNATHPTAVTCTMPPAPSLVIWSTPNITNGSTSGTTYYGATYTVSWGAVANATSCTLDGGAVATTGGTSTGAATGWGGNSHTFTLSCTGPGGTGTSTNTITYPAQPTISSSSCAGLGNSATVGWTDPNGWNTFYTRAYTGAVQALYNDAATGTTATFATTPGAAYDFWVHTRSANGSYSNPVHSLFTCANPPPTVTVTSTPSPIAWGAASTFTWSSSNAASCSTAWAASTATGFGPVNTGALYSNTTITVTCSNGGGSTAASTTITVTARPAPTVSVTANPVSVAYGGSSNVTWTSTNADSCSSTGGGGTAAFGSFSTGALYTNQTYTVTCTGNGTASNSVTVSVIAPTITITANGANPAYILYRNTAVINWTSTNAGSCSSVSTPLTTTSGTFTTSALTGSTIPSTTKTFRVTCVGNGSVTGTATINVCAQRYTTIGTCTKQALKPKYKEN